MHGNIIQDPEQDILVAIFSGKNKDFTSYDVFEILEEKTTADKSIMLLLL